MGLEVLEEGDSATCMEGATGTVLKSHLHAGKLGIGLVEVKVPLSLYNESLGLDVNDDGAAAAGAFRLAATCCIHHVINHTMSSTTSRHQPHHVINHTTSSSTPRHQPPLHQPLRHHSPRHHHPQRHSPHQGRLPRRLGPRLQWQLLLLPRRRRRKKQSSCRGMWTLSRHGGRCAQWATRYYYFLLISFLLY